MKKIKKNSIIKPLPIFPWVGGKRKLAQQIIKIVTQNNQIKFDKLIEPFCGGLGFTLEFNSQYPKTKIICSDNNKWLTDTYNNIKYNCNDVYNYLEELNNQWNSLPTKIDKKQWYYQLRSNFTSRTFKGPVESAVFIALVKTGYNGLMQINTKGELTTAFGFGVVNKLLNKENFKLFAKTIKNWEFKYRQFEDSLKDITNKSRNLGGTKTLVYLDPIYKSSKQMYAGSLIKNPMFRNPNEFDQYRVVNFMKSAIRKGAHTVAMSNSYDPEFWREAFYSEKENLSIYEIERNQGAHRNVVEKGRYKVKENLIVLSQ